MKKNRSAQENPINVTSHNLNVTISKMLQIPAFLLLLFVLTNQIAVASGSLVNLTDSTENNTGINLPHIDPRPTLEKEEITNNDPPPTIPDLVFCLNGNEAAEGFSLTMCSSSTLEFSLCEVNNGVAPFTICFEINGNSQCAQGVESGDLLLTENFNTGTNIIKITSITDAIGNGSPYTESLVFTIQVNNPPTADAGANATICETNMHVFNMASAGSFSSLMWTGGDGTFIPSAEVLNPMYIPGPNDIANGIIEVSLTANSVDPCTSIATDFMLLSIRNNANSEAGNDIVVCEDQGFVELNGNIQNGLPIWEAASYNGGFFEDPLSTSTKYYFSALDIEQGTIQLNLIAIPAAPCVLPQSDFLEVTIIKSPDAFAGNDITITDVESVNLTEATIENSEFVEWTTNGDGTFSDINEVNPTYFPGAGDIAEGDVKLILSAMPADCCTVNSMDMITIDIIQPETFTSPEQHGMKTSTFDEEIELFPAMVETNVFPNPATDFVNINSNKEISSILVINSAGQQVMHETVDGNSTTMQVAHLEKGMHILVLQFRDQTRTTKKINIR
jgi:hypothetical protein